jgi:hypothetical protein
MYILFREKNWKPSDYHSIPEGEKKIINVFLRQEMSEKEEEARELRKLRSES